MEFRKAHGTGNDFVVLPDPDGRLQLTDRLVQGLCDRRFGIGADGVLRVVRTAAAGEQFAEAPDAEWFMDYRNADGSRAQMCGNGARVYADYLWRSGLAPSGPLRFATRGGVRTAVLLPDGAIRVDMGRAVCGQPGAVQVGAAGHSWPATQVHVPNPHAVVFVDDLAVAGDLRSAPHLHPVEAFPEGANVEFVVRRARGHIAMRVHERGVGETLSCGTGACAVAAAYAMGEPEAHLEVLVDVPGGRLVVGLAPDGEVSLTGPVATVASGQVDERWLAGHGNEEAP